MPPRPSATSRAPAQSAFGRELQRLREALGLNKLQAQRRTGVHNSYWTQLERGWIWRKRKDHPDGGVWAPAQNPSVGILTQICDGFRLARADCLRLFALAQVEPPAYLRHDAARSGPAPRPPASDGTYDALSDDALNELARFVTAAQEQRAERPGQHDRGRQRGDTEKPGDGPQDAGRGRR